MEFKKGDRYGTHRVISPKGVLPQPADAVDNTMEIYDNEVLIDVHTLNIDSASFTEIERRADGDVEKIKEIIMGIVEKTGKHKNPWTGSGGMLVGTVKEVGPHFEGDLKPGDKIATLVSLSLTPLKIEEILDIRQDIDQVDIKGKAILFQSGIYAKLPDDMPEGLALSALDVAGAPAQTAKLVKPGMKVMVIGGGGKSGLGDERNAPVMFLHGHSAESGAETTLRQKEAEGLGTNPSCAHGAAHAEHFPMGSMIEFKVNFCRRGEDKGGRPSTHAVECGQGPLGRQG